MNWTRTNLGEFAPFSYGKSLPKEQRIPGAVPVYGSNGVVGLHNSAFVDGPAVIVGRKGSVGEVHLSELPSWPIDTAFFAQGSDKADLNFLYYLLKTLPITSNSDSAVPGLNRDFAHSLEFHAPSLATQKAIGLTLRALDNKIDVNAALSKTLEDIAQAIFKSWFIDFDPVKAKMAGKKPVGMDDETASLFPDSLIESELGMIPSGWSVTGLEEVATVKYGAPFASKHFNSVGDGTPLIRIRDLRKQSIATWTTEIHSKGFQVTGGDLLVGMDGEFNPTLWFGEDAWVNQRICKIEPKSFVSNFFTYFKLIPVMRRIEHGSTGSTVIHLGKSDLDSITISVPTQEISLEFRKLLSPLLVELTNLHKQNRILSEIRERMLPRLVSGELQIPKDMLAS